jgi:NAD+ synthetase
VKRRVALCQIGSDVGDIKGNTEKILKIYNDADAEMVVFPELSLTGYNCQDLFLNKNFLNSIKESVARIVSESNGKVLIIGTPMEVEGKLFNSALIIQNGQLIGQYNKKFLPNYDTFDEKRYFCEGNEHGIVFDFNGLKVGLLICEDVWHCRKFDCDLAIVINASPFSINKLNKRVEVVKAFMKQNTIHTIAYLNAFCAQDHLVFDGSSFVMSSNHDYQMIIPPVKWEEKVIKLDLDQRHSSIPYSIKKSHPLDLDDETAADVYEAILLSLKEYGKYARCNKFVIGLSGGIDSALVTVIAADAFGPENILCVAMPSKFSSKASLDDAVALVKKIGCEMITIPIGEVKNSFDVALLKVLGKLNDNEITNENIQPRIRATILMAIANKQNRLLLCTSNKSESAVGYTTLYGDMTGAFAPIADLYKTQVYAISRWRNKNEYVIPQNIIEKEPTAELKPNQKDSDALPPYDVLDRILYDLIESRDSLPSNNPAIEKMLLRNEFKRYQSPLAPKINKMLFNTDRRYPIGNT